MKNLPVVAVPPTEANVPFGRDNTFYLVWDSFVNLNILVLVILGLSQLDNMSIPCGEAMGAGDCILASWKVCEVVVSPCST